MTEASLDPQSMYVALRTLMVDRTTARITEEFEHRGIPTVLLKGPALTEWLYRDGTPRPYGDTDLLLAPDRWDDAHQVMRDLGFADALEPLGHPRMESLTSYPWVKGTEEVDLHCTLWGFGVDPERAWGLLSRRTITMQVAGRTVRALDAPARALHIGLHAAQHGGGQPMEDLRRALDQLTEGEWAEAKAIADELDATDAFGTGLRLHEKGADLANRLGIEEGRSTAIALRAAQMPLAAGFEHLAQSPTMRAKAALVASELLPKPAFMRWWSPLARRGRAGLALSYPWRWIWLAYKAPESFMAWRSVRRSRL